MCVGAYEWILHLSLLPPTLAFTVVTLRDSYLFSNSSCPKVGSTYVQPPLGSGKVTQLKGINKDTNGKELKAIGIDL